MSQVSKRTIDKKAYDKIFDLLILSLVLADNKETASLLIKDLFSPTERIMISKRISIAYMLIQGYDYESISLVLKVSRATIGKVSFWLKEKGEGFRQIIEKIKKKEKMNQILDEIQELYLDILGSSKGQNWSKAKKELWLLRMKKNKPF